MAHGNILITGCDSGLGLEFVRYLSTLESVNRVYAGYMDLDRATVNFLTLTNKQNF
jgi:short-subunit dehydrogenase involved in D-alanine esterification of teichoic acids